MNEFRDVAALPDFEYRGARASVVLHEEQLRHFLQVWTDAKTSGLRLPVCDDPDYASHDALLRHVLRWARGYLIWICAKLDLPDPGIDPVPDIDVIASQLDAYVEHLLTAWRTPLCGLPLEKIAREVHEAPWGTLYSIDAMLEHAVMHSYKHRFQLEELA